MKTNKVFKSIFIIAFILLTLFILTPILLIVLRGMKNIKVCLKSREILRSVKLSLTTSFISTFICLIFSIPTAYILARYDFPFKTIISTLIYLPMSLPHIVSGIALLLLFGNTRIGRVLAELGLDFVFTVKGIVVAQIFVNIPHTVKILKTTLEDVDPKTEFIARTLGSNSIQTFFYITLPLMKNGLIAAIVMTWSRALGEFGAVLMLAGATRYKTETLPISIFLNVSTGELDLAITTATLLILISLISIAIFEICGVSYRE